MAAWLPRPLVDAYRWLRLEFPVPAGDLLADLGDLTKARSLRLPPAGLRRETGRTATRAEYVDAGRGAAEEIRRALSGMLPAVPGPWLDFGCACGRIARHLVRLPTCGTLTGVDPDLDSIRWCERHLEGRYLAIGPQPPMPLADAGFDVIVAASVFTHLDEPEQNAWLTEMRRVLRPGGLLVASTHGADLHVERPDLSEAARQRLRDTGFGFAARHGHFNTGTAYHSRSYMERTWGSLLKPVRWIDRGLFGIQDLSVWTRDGR